MARKPAIRRNAQPVQPVEPIHPVHPFDRRYGTDTSGLLPAEWLAAGTTLRLTDLTAYYGIAPSILHQLVEIWQRDLEPDATLEQTIFYDVGAGKGRALLLAAEYPWLRVEGVELNPALAAIAQANISTRQLHADPLPAPLHIHAADATTHPLPTTATLAFLFHPFERTVLRRFLRHVERSVRRDPRPFDLVYVNAEHADILEANPAFRRLWSGRVPMSPDDHVADLAAIAAQREYGSTGDEICAIYRFDAEL